MALNAMLIDPGRVWQGVWRWWDDSMLDCCEPLDLVRKSGIIMTKLACLAKCNGANSRTVFAKTCELSDLRAHVLLCTAERDTPSRPTMIASYSRAALNQTGSGHFSPVAAYAPQSDMVSY